MNGCSPYEGKTGSSLTRGSGFYVDSDLYYNPRIDLNFKAKSDDCEIKTSGIDIVFDNQPNRLKDTLIKEKLEVRITHKM